MRYFILILLGIYGSDLLAQSLRGTVTDVSSGETIPMVNIVVKSGQTIVQGGATDFDGNYFISPLFPGTYNVEVSYIGYATKKFKGVIISPSKSTQLDVQLAEDNGLLEDVCLEYVSPIIDKDRKGRTVRKSDYAAKPIRRVSGLVAQAAGIAQADQGASLTVCGGRSDQTVYFVDGVKVLGTPNIANSAMDQIRVNTSGVPAEYGNGGSDEIGRKPDTSPILWFSKDEPEKDVLEDESYEEIPENDFLDSYQNPVTTFSIDVDHASYSNIRRFINNGVEPPKDAVRLEEMINYFDYNYSKPQEEVISAQTELSICPWNKKHQLLHIGLQSEAFKEVPTDGNNFVFLIDVSGSMSTSNKLPLVKKTLTMLTKQMNEKDKISIVVYAGAAGCVLEPTSAKNQKKILEALDHLESGGGTAGGAGIELAYKLAQENYMKNGNNRVVLATDGDFNIGVSSNKSLEGLIAEKRNSNIFLTVLGYGMGNYKDDKLELLANKGNGNYAYIDNLQEAEDFLVKGFKSTMFTIAKDVKLQLEFNPKYVESYRLIGYENRALENRDFIDDGKDAGELGTDQSVTALYEIIPTRENKKSNLKYRQVVDSEELLTLKIRYKKPKGTKSTELVYTFNRKLLDLEDTSESFQFSASVAMFGLILKDSKYKGQAKCSQVIKMAKQAKTNDEFGYKGEFIRLVRTYKNSFLSLN